MGEGGPIVYSKNFDCGSCGRRVVLGKLILAWP